MTRDSLHLSSMPLNGSYFSQRQTNFSKTYQIFCFQYSIHTVSLFDTRIAYSTRQNAIFSAPLLSIHQNWMAALLNFSNWLHYVCPYHTVGRHSLIFHFQAKYGCFWTMTTASWRPIQHNRVPCDFQVQYIIKVPCDFTIQHIRVTQYQW